ncbi:MAG: glycosyltransferase family 39 protein [bacterium]|nr:glycosyltransferase family 39 protein [bacterium]MDZ4231316.1 glycosyltransferase family 39 protein [Patescibacteria group bacterium]
MQRKHWWLILILVVAAALRFASIDSVPPGLYPDEAMNGNNALEALRTGDFKVFYPENNGREGLFINIQALSLSAFGNTPWALRLPSTIFGLLTVLGVYFLTREIFFYHRSKEALSLLATFLLATSFWHINFSRIAFRAIMAPATLVWGMYFLLLSFRRARLPGYLNRLFLPAAGGIIYGLGLHSYIAYRITPIIILAVLIFYFFQARKERWLTQFYKTTVLFIVFSFLTFLPLGIYFAENPQDFLGRTSQISIFSSKSPISSLAINTLKTAGMFNVAGDGNWRHNIAERPLLFWPVGIMFLVGIISGVLALFKRTQESQATKEKIAFFLLFIWFAAAALPVVISSEGLPHALRAILMAPAVFILASLGGLSIFNYLKTHFRIEYLKVAVSVLIAVLIMEAYTSYFITWAKDPNTAEAFNRDYALLGEELNSLSPDQTKYVVVTAEGAQVHGIPMPAQTVMFLTDTFGLEQRQAKNIYYLTPDELSEPLPESASLFYIR